MPSDASHADARDRTALSWERSALTLGALAAIFLSVADRVAWLAMPAALLLGLAAVAVALYARGLARRRARAAVPVAPAWAAGSALTAIVLLTALFATAVVIVQA
jgi:Domain of unknown function (DUF202)